jgi:hypothetical protein
MSGVLLPNTYFKGDTQPWEKEGWVHYAGGPDAGIILARQLGPLAANETLREASRPANDTLRVHPSAY